MTKDASLRFRLPKDLHQQFLAICKAQDKPAAQVLREYMRSYVQRHRNLLADQAPDDLEKRTTTTR
jgi:predicted DNA-binding protein